MKKLTITPGQHKVADSEKYTAPVCTEMHFSDGVFLVLAEILDISPNIDSWYPPDMVLNRLDKVGRNMETFRVKMRSVKLWDKDFTDLIETLREIAIYAKNTKGFLSFKSFKDKEKSNEYSSENNPKSHD